MTDLRSGGPGSCNPTPDDCQDKFKQMDFFFTTMSSNPPEVNCPAAVTTALSLHSKEPKKSVNIEAPVHEVSP